MFGGPDGGKRAELHTSNKARPAHRIITARPYPNPTLRPTGQRCNLSNGRMKRDSGVQRAASTYLVARALEGDIA